MAVKRDLLWCSWCFQKTVHAKKVVSQKFIGRIGRIIFICQKCLQETARCMAPKCLNMTKKGFKHRWCAEHDGSIGSFESLNMRLGDLTDWKVLTHRQKYNLKKVEKIGMGAASVAVLFIPPAGAATNTMAGIVGRLLGKPAGGAAVRHGLAVLGGGTKAAGGLGMVGGKAIIVVSAATLGGVKGGVLVNAYAKEVDFNITKKHSGKGPKVIFVNGFLTQGEDQIEGWRATLETYFPNNPWYELAWESKNLRNLGTCALEIGKRETLVRTMKGLAAKSLKAQKGLDPWRLLTMGLGLVGNPWSQALYKAKLTGALLADVISRIKGNSQYILIGHSLGARAIFYALEALGQKENTKRRKIREVHLLGGAVGKENLVGWKSAAQAVSHGIVNYYSKNDQVLQILYRTGTLFNSEPIGLKPIEYVSNSIHNMDVTWLVNSHAEFKSNLSNFLWRPKANRQ